MKVHVHVYTRTFLLSVAKNFLYIFGWVGRKCFIADRFFTAGKEQHATQSEHQAGSETNWYCYFVVYMYTCMYVPSLLTSQQLLLFWSWSNMHSTFQKLLCFWAKNYVKIPWKSSLAANANEVELMRSSPTIQDFHVNTQVLTPFGWMFHMEIIVAKRAQWMEKKKCTTFQMYHFLNVQLWKNDLQFFFHIA